MGTKSALQILEQLRQMPNVPGQTRQSLVMLCDVLNNADAHPPNEVHLANASLFALEQVLAQQGTVMSKEEFKNLDDVIKAFSEERARERRILARAKKRLERNEPLSDDDQVLMATWSGELLQEPPELLHTPASISSPLGVTSLVDTCNRKPQAALNAALAVAYGAAVKPVFPVTEAEHRSSLKNLVRSAAKTKGRK